MYVCNNDTDEVLTIDDAIKQRIVRNLRNRPWGEEVTSSDGTMQFRLNPETGQAEMRQLVNNLSRHEDILELPPETPSVVNGSQLNPYGTSAGPYGPTHVDDEDALPTPRTAQVVMNERIEEVARRRAAAHGGRVSVIDMGDDDLLPPPQMKW